MLASRAGFRAYSVRGGPGERVGPASRSRLALVSYLAARHAHDEQFVLTWFGPATRKNRGVRFSFNVVRGADDIQPPVAYLGTGTVDCTRRHRLTGWSMKPTGEPARPTPETYADTCKLVGQTWCEDTPTPGGVPAELRRPLHMPTVHPGAACPTTTPHPFDGPGLGGLAFGAAPIAPLIAPGWVHADGVHFYATGPSGWYAVKTMWLATPQYRGPVLIRGRQLDGPHKVFMGQSPISWTRSSARARRSMGPTDGESGRA